MHEADDVAPFIAMLDRSDGALAGKRPDPLQNWLEPDPVFVNRPELDGRLGIGCRHRAQQRTQMLPEVFWGLRVGLHIARAGHPQPCAQAPQVHPAELTTDASAETLADPGGDRPPAPALPLRCSSCRQCRHQLVLLHRSQERGAWSRLVPTVFDAVRSVLVVAPSDVPDPIGRIARDAGNHFGGQSAR